MATGLLRITGTLDTAQFWPKGESDGDTVKVAVDADSFAFRPFPTEPFQVTHAFEGARVRGKGTKTVIDTKGRIDIRLQGIDAPELHYRPTFTKLDAAARAAVKDANRNFRQPLGATAAVRLGEFLQALGGNIPCTVVTAVDEPNDVCDAYGRVVGDILVTADGHDEDVNHWMAARGWAFPAFYSSMSDDEITQIAELAARAKAAGLGIWPAFTDKVVRPDFDLVFPKKSEAPDPDADTGDVIFPKFFRRSCSWAVGERAGLTGRISFKSFLAQQAEPDICFLRDELLTDGIHTAIPHRLTEFVHTDGTVEQRPEDLVFKEAKSTLFDANGELIRDF